MSTDCGFPAIFPMRNSPISQETSGLCTIFGNISVQRKNARARQRDLPNRPGNPDAIHLATALAIREVVAVDWFLIHHVQLAIARSLGFSVLGVS